MTLISRAVFAALLVLPGAAIAGEFDGTWKNDPASWKISTPDEYLLKDGSYTCLAGCDVRVAIPADGADHAVAGSAYADMLAVTAVDDHTVRIVSKKGGAKVADSTGVVSGDGKTLTWTFSNSSNTNGGPPITGTSSENRVSDGPAGTHAISGKWMFVGAASMSDNVLHTTFKQDGDTLTMSQPTGQAYTAVLGGPDAAYKGDPGINSVSVKRAGPHAIQETDKLNGAVIWVGTMTVSDDGKTMTTIWDDKRYNQSGSGLANKE